MSYIDPFYVLNPKLYDTVLAGIRLAEENPSMSTRQAIAFPDHQDKGPRTSPFDAIPVGTFIVNPNSGMRSIKLTPNTALGLDGGSGTPFQVGDNVRYLIPSQVDIGFTF